MIMKVDKYKTTLVAYIVCRLIFAFFLGWTIGDLIKLLR